MKKDLETFIEEMSNYEFKGDFNTINYYLKPKQTEESDDPLPLVSLVACRDRAPTDNSSDL